MSKKLCICHLVTLAIVTEAFGSKMTVEPLRYVGPTLQAHTKQYQGMRWGQARRSCRALHGIFICVI